MCGDHQGEQVQSTGLKHACGLHQYMLPIPDPIAVRLYPNLLSDSPSYCPYVLVIILRPITVTGCVSECFPYLYNFGHPKGVLDSRILPGDFGACFCVSLKYQNCNISLPPSFDFILMRLTHDTMPLLAIRQMDLCPPTFTHQTISAALFIA